MKPLDVVLTKDKKNGSYWGGMKWINSTAIEVAASDKTTFFRNLFDSISDFFPETYIDNNLNYALAEWNRLNSDIPYEMGIAYLAPYWEIIRKSDRDTWNQKTIPMTDRKSTRLNSSHVSIS